MIGTTYLELSLSHLRARTVTLWRALALALVGTVIVAGIIAWRLQRIVSAPLLRLTQITRTMTHDRNYNIRAVNEGDDEIGELVDGFNEMLENVPKALDRCLEGLDRVVNAAHAIGDVVQGSDRRGRITVRTRREGESVVIRIGDTGGGIPDAIRGRVFDPFFPTKEVGKGTGQGLAIARSVILENHGGHLTFETEVGQGTTFIIRLPIDGKKPAALGAAA